jgi:hypothetical protein
LSSQDRGSSSALRLRSQGVLPGSPPLARGGLIKVTPPSTQSNWPVIQRASGLARKATTPTGNALYREIRDHGRLGVGAQGHPGPRGSRAPRRGIQCEPTPISRHACGELRRSFQRGPAAGARVAPAFRRKPRGLSSTRLLRGRCRQPRRPGSRWRST